MNKRHQHHRETFSGPFARRLNLVGRTLLAAPVLLGGIGFAVAEGLITFAVGLAIIGWPIGILLATWKQELKRLDGELIEILTVVGVVRRRTYNLANLRGIRLRNAGSKSTAMLVFPDHTIIVANLDDRELRRFSEFLGDPELKAVLSEDPTDVED